MYKELLSLVRVEQDIYLCIHPSIRFLYCPNNVLCNNFYQFDRFLFIFLNIYLFICLFMYHFIYESLSIVQPMEDVFVNNFDQFV